MIRRLRLLARDGTSTAAPVLQQLVVHDGMSAERWEDVPVVVEAAPVPSVSPVATGSGQLNSSTCTVEPFRVGVLLRHYRGGLYTFVGEASDSEANGRQLFLYRAGTMSSGRLWARPASMFDNLVDGSIRRFTDHDWAGGNDYTACRLCRLEYDYRKVPMPASRCPRSEMFT